MDKEVLQIVASSWPIAAMFVAACVVGVVIYLIRSFRQADREDKAYRAAQARDVTAYRDNAGGGR